MSEAHASLASKVTGISATWGVLLIVIGVLAISLPMATAIAVNILLAWLIIFGGVVHLVFAFGSHGAGHVVWKALVGTVYVLGGGYLLFHPPLGIASLALLLAAFFLAEGVLLAIAYFTMRPLSGSGWYLLDAIVTILLAFLIWKGWPNSSAWMIGTLVGINILFSGISRLMLSVAVRKLLRAAA